MSNMKLSDIQVGFEMLKDLEQIPKEQWQLAFNNVKKQYEKEDMKNNV